MKLSKWLFILGVVAVRSALAAQPDSDDLERNFENTQRLLEVSSAAKRIERSGNTEAQAIHEMAKGLYNEALQARDAGDEAQAAELLQEIKKWTFNAVRLVAAGQVGTDQKKADSDKLERKFADTARLLEASPAAARIEHSGNTAAQAIGEIAKELYSDALRARDAGDEAQAVKLLKEANKWAVTAVRLADLRQVMTDE